MNVSARGLRRIHVVLLFVVALLIVVAVTAARPPLSCVTRLEPNEGATNAVPDVTEVCFESLVEAVRYATGGRVDLPENASKEAVFEALMSQ